MLCRLSDLPDPGAREFRIGAGEWPVRIFVVREGSTAYAYLNRCPHAGHPLNWQPDRFLAPGGKLLLCASHGALFDKPTGQCVAGPCVGARLTAIEIDIVADRIGLRETPESLVRRLG
jgi:nitrite reductase/ring-hydroxylating ferredoxin subunit